MGKATSEETGFSWSCAPDPQVKAALEKAAKSDARSVSSLIQKVLGDWLKEGKFLK